MEGKDQLRIEVTGLAPKNGHGPHSQFVKGYKRALRDVLELIDTKQAKEADKHE